MFEEIEKNIKYLTRILKKHNFEHKQIQYSYLPKGYWLLGIKEDRFLGDTLEKAEDYLIKYIKSHE